MLIIIALIPSLDTGGQGSRRGTGGRASLYRRSGQLHAAFWRQLGFPNLVLARAAKARKRQAQIRQEILEKARRFDPYVTLEESPRWAEILGMPYPYRLNKPRRGGY